ncbi:aryl carrier domain protein [Vibrio nigripulchritudo ATCC 27043]|uniref:Aryl carrier domain protein n=1 Tax=Vibrio nigripulchritudo SOn1 TaxID=1238450 RepID=A0AAV2VKA1_9VIBR|nr:aryl carrier domain protein [Vibrio nigripulchritudo ATCC 27043]CCO45087.1 Aryl carrier domain protein [Vibrio nigripulchritudo SOn1]
MSRINEILEVNRNLPKKKDIVLSTQVKNLDLLADVSQLLGVPAESISPETNLIELGLDSISLMRFTGQLRSKGIDIKFDKLIESPTIESWDKLINA